MLKKLSYKLITSYIILIFILVISVFLMVESLLKKTHIEMIKNEMSHEVEIINTSLIKSSISPLKIREEEKILYDYAQSMQIRITIIDKDGKVIADTDADNPAELDNHYYRTEVYQATQTGQGSSIRHSNTLKTDMLYFAKNFEGYVIRLAKPLYAVDESIRELKTLTARISVIVLLASIIVIIFISIKVTRPFNETISFANNFAEGNYRKRILNYSNDEIGTLQRSLNKMADTIVETIDQHIFEKNKLEATLESIGDGIAMIDSAKRILISNKAFSELLNITMETKEKPYFEVIRNRLINSKIEKGLSSGEKDFFEVESINDRFFEAVINPIKADDKIIQGILLVIHDASERKKIERIKSDLVSNVSHELKTPIAIVKGYLETIRENPDNREMMNDFIERAIENVDRQNALIQDIIKLSMIESSKEFEKEEINVKQIILSCLDIVTPKINKKEIKLKTNLPSEINYKITANQFLVEEVFFNIIDNAINYNNQNGRLDITADIKNEGLIIKISDSGIGIPSEYIERIFERFYRVDRSRSRATGGTGLGLSIVKHAAMVLGWRVSVASDKNGTSFTVEI
ncbi:MAG TPA: ATP-binding protein [Spirochaetota bacterium]|nr:ATP-binding protein [Spirochaetota bacterium]